MTRLSIEARQKVITLHLLGYPVLEIYRRLREENTSISRQALYNLIKKHRDRGTVADLPRRKRQRKITEQMRAMIEEELNKNDELTSSCIKTLLTEKWLDLQVSVQTIKRVRKEMGWVCTRPHYCQLLREVS